MVDEVLDKRVVSSSPVFCSICCVCSVSSCRFSSTGVCVPQAVRKSVVLPSAINASCFVFIVNSTEKIKDKAEKLLGKISFSGGFAREKSLDFLKISVIITG